MLIGSIFSILRWDSRLFHSLLRHKLRIGLLSVHWLRQEGVYLLRGRVKMQEYRLEMEFDKEFKT